MSRHLTPRWSAPFLAALATVAVPGLDAVATRHPRIVTPTMEITGVLAADGGSWIVRAPRDAATGAALMAESELLRILSRENLPFALAVPAGFATLEDGGPAVIHRALPGRELDLATLRPGPGLAASLGTSIAALHEVSVDAVAALDLPTYDAAECRTRLLAELDELAASRRVPTVLLRRWEEALEDVRSWRFRPVLVHGDLVSDRVLVEPGRVTGVIDFANAHVGDPALDLGWLVAAAPEDALESILEAYDVHRSAGSDGQLLVRAQLYSELALGRWLLHGIRVGDRGVVADAEDMLAELADAVTSAEEDPDAFG